MYAVNMGVIGIRQWKMDKSKIKIRVRRKCIYQSVTNSLTSLFISFLRTLFWRLNPNYPNHLIFSRMDINYSLNLLIRW